MSNSALPAKLPKGTVAVPAAAIGAMSMILAVGFHSVGLNARVDAGLIAWLGSIGLGTTPVILPPAIGWAIAILLGFLLPFSILETPGHLRRILLWLSCLIIVLGGLPVLGLSAKWWTQTPVLIVVFWGGLCAVIYAGRHWMPCEGGNAEVRRKSKTR